MLTFPLERGRKYQRNVTGEELLAVFEILVNICSCQTMKSPKNSFMNEPKAEI